MIQLTECQRKRAIYHPLTISGGSEFFLGCFVAPRFGCVLGFQSDGSDGSDPTKDTGAADLLLFMLLFVFLGMALAAC